jgi:hypothetical protein
MTDEIDVDHKDIIKYMINLKEFVTKNSPTIYGWSIIPHPTILYVLSMAGWSEEEIREIFLGEGAGWERWLETLETQDE